MKREKGLHQWQEKGSGEINRQESMTKHWGTEITTEEQTNRAEKTHATATRPIPICWAKAAGSP
jgi:hypothetical protein